MPPRTLLQMFEDGAGDFGTIRLLHYPGDGGGRARPAVASFAWA